MLKRVGQNFPLQLSIIDKKLEEEDFGPRKTQTFRIENESTTLKVPQVNRNSQEK